MICLDKLKIVTSTKHIERFDESQFLAVFKNGKLQYYKFHQKIPYELLIMINFEKDELVIEFTSKILGLGFINLINKDTIYECLCNVAPSVKFNDDVEYILDDFEVLKCDVTKDVTYSDVKKLERYAKTNLSNYDKWKCEHQKNGFVLKNVAGTPRNKKRIVIYNKRNELKLGKNKEFLKEEDRWNDGSFIFEYFENKVRFEMNINTKIQIRQLLNISDNKLISVLNSEANPILDVLNEALKEIPANSDNYRNMKEYHYQLTLKDCDYDLGKVEAKIRSLYSKNTQIVAVMKPYRNLLQRLKNTSEPAFDLRKLVV